MTFNSNPIYEPEFSRCLRDENLNVVVPHLLCACAVIVSFDNQHQAIRLLAYSLDQLSAAFEPLCFLILLSLFWAVRFHCISYLTRRLLECLTFGAWFLVFF